MASRVTLMRHGETSAGKVYIGSTDVELTDNGWQQMKAAVDEALSSGQQWQRIVSSPLARCCAFAEQLSLHTGAALSILPELAEYHFGDWEGMSAIEVMEQYPGALEAFWEDPQANPPSGGEHLDDFVARLDRAMEVLCDQPEEAVIAICHGGVIRYLKCRRDGAPISQMLSYKVEHAHLETLHLAGDA